MRRTYLRKIFFYATVVIIVIIQVLPIYTIFATSFKKGIDIVTHPSYALAFPTFRNYLNIFTKGYFAAYFVNSLIVASSVTAISVFLGSLAAYSFTRMKFAAGKPLSIGILTSRLVPPIAFAIPIFVLIGKLHLLDTHFAIIMAHLTFNLPLAVWLLFSFFRNVPMEIEEASFLDGCSRLRAYFKIFLPLVAPGILTASIMCFNFSWSEFLFASLLTSSAAKTMPLAVSAYIAEFGIEWADMTAAASVMIIPIFLLVFIFHKYFEIGLSMGLVK